MDVERGGFVPCRIRDANSVSQRTDLLVSIRRDIDLAPQLGKHPYSVFLRNPPRVGADSRASLITRAKYQSAEQIVGMGEGWKPG